MGDREGGAAEGVVTWLGEVVWAVPDGGRRHGRRLGVRAAH